MIKFSLLAQIFLLIEFLEGLFCVALGCK